MSDATKPADDRPAVTGAPIGSAQGRREALTGDDAGPGSDGANPYPGDGASPDRGSSVPRD